MIITRTPLRISIAGGGCDLPSYYGTREQTIFISAAINKYCYVAVNKSFGNKFLIKYSKYESAVEIGDIAHPIVRAALTRIPMPLGTEIVSVADIPAGTGLGSSGAFTVGLVKALKTYLNLNTSTHEICELAFSIEALDLGEPVGKQDQYATAFGGLSRFEITESGEVSVQRLLTAKPALQSLQDTLLLFFTGISRDSSNILRDQVRLAEANNPELSANLDFVQSQCIKIEDAILSENSEYLGQLMNEHWAIKKQRSHGMSNSSIDLLYDAGLSAGAIGGKLVGAGGGGFLLFVTKQPHQLRLKMQNLNVQEVPFTFDNEGTVVIASN